MQLSELSVKTDDDTRMIIKHNGWIHGPVFRFVKSSWKRVILECAGAACRLDSTQSVSEHEVDAKVHNFKILE